MDNKVVLITGGTGSFGKKFVERILQKYNPSKVIIYSRDEHKQYLMHKQFIQHEDKLRFFIGDVRDRERLYRAFDGVDIIIHAAALEHVPIIEYNPLEAIKTNVIGAANIIDAAIDCGVEKVFALSTDKAVNPINLYGASKLCSDKLFVAGNAYSGKRQTQFSVVRYGNVAGSRGSVIPYFSSLIKQEKGSLPITDSRMTRFWITLDEGVDLVFKAIATARGGEVYVAKIPSFRVVDLATAMSPQSKQEQIGIREGEKLHELMITKEDARTTYEYDKHYVIYPNFDWWDIEKHLIPGGKKVADHFEYSSDTNPQFLTVQELQSYLNKI